MATRAEARNRLTPWRPGAAEEPLAPNRGVYLKDPVLRRKSPASKPGFFLLPSAEELEPQMEAGSEGAVGAGADPEQKQDGGADRAGCGNTVSRWTR